MTTPSPLEAVFFAALERRSPAEQAAYLDEACANDRDLRDRVERMLAAGVNAGSFLEVPAHEIAQTIDHSVPQTITEKPGNQIGPYKLLQQIGEGGMGVVYMAEQKVPVKRRVALKIIKPGMDTRQVIARFEAERQALAMMDHPNIAKVLDAGATESGRPYFVMELVNGLPVTNYCDEQHLTPKERLELFVSICQAVQHAHQKGIIHRDLKPSNILVAMYDNQAVPKIIDFGVAKATAQTLTDKTMFTQLGQVVGTLEYMSPEQAQRNQLDIDTRSDIYSLGVVLYELLTGDTPFDRELLRSAGFEEILRIIREEEPSKPSTKVSRSQSLPSIAAHRRIEPEKLGRMIRGELDWIVLKAMEKDRGRRYETASKFAEDVQHYLNDEAVEACPPSMAYKVRKLVRRNRGPIIAGSMVATALLIGIIGTTFGLIRSERTAARERKAREEESQQRMKAERLIDRTLGILDSVTSEESVRGMTMQQELTDDQRRFFNTVLEYYQELAKESGDREEDRLRAAEAAKKVAIIQVKLGLIQTAIQSFAISRDGFEALASDYPQNTQYLSGLAASHLGLANFQTWLFGSSSEVEQECRKAITLLEQLLKQDPDNLKYWASHARAQYLLAVSLAKGGGDEDSQQKARQLIRSSAQSLQRLVDRNDDRQTENALASMYVGWGYIAGFLQGDYAASFDPWQKSYTILEALRRENPTDKWTLELSTLSCWGMGRMHSYFGDLAEAETTLRQALHLYREVAEQYPSQSTYSDDLAFSNIFLAEVLEKRMKLSEAESCFRQALVVREQNVADVPKAEMYRIHIIRIHLGLQSVLNAVGHTEEAEEHYQQAIHQARRLAEIAQEQIAESPDDVKRYVGLGKAYLILAKVMQEQPSFEYYSETILHPVQRAGKASSGLTARRKCLDRLPGVFTWTRLLKPALWRTRPSDSMKQPSKHGTKRLPPAPKFGSQISGC
jgi:eukaryotic-like serine/threonine-protein kinase